MFISREADVASFYSLMKIKENKTEITSSI